MFPGVAQKITRNRHFWKQDQIGLAGFGLLNELQHFFRVEIGTTGNHFDLRQGNFQQLTHLEMICGQGFAMHRSNIRRRISDVLFLKK